MNYSRVRAIVDGDRGDGPIVYWMSRDQRAHDNWALVYAAELANERSAPLAVAFCLQPQFLNATRRHYAWLLRGLRVDKAAMMANLDRMRGYLLSERVMLELGEKVGKQNAHEWIYEASMHGIENRLDFAEAMRRHPEISRVSNDADITRMTDPSGYLGEAGD